MNEQIRLLAGEDPELLIARAREEHEPIASYCLFSGGHDSTVLAHRCRDHYDTLAFIDTTTALPGVVEFVEEFAGWVDKPLRILRPDHDPFREMVQTAGFPGPAQHNMAYRNLKERQLERLLREAKAGYPRSSRVMFLSGVRRAESQRRAKRFPVTRRGGAVFVNPLIDWTDSQMRAYRFDHAIPESDVAALIHRSGECNCSAYATADERDELQALFPDWWEERIAPLEAEAEALGIPSCRWGEGRDRTMRLEEDSPMCSDCQLRIEAA